MSASSHAATEVAPGIYTLDHAVADGKNAVLLGERGAWVVDTGTSAEEGRALIEFVEAQGYAADKLLYTHGHPDHVLGSRDFRGALVVAPALTPVEMRRLLPVWARRRQVTPAELAQEIAWPNVTFSAELYLDLGNLHVRVFPTPGHSQDGVSLYVEEHKLLLAGDAVVTGIVPAIGDGDSRTLCATLAMLQRLEIDILVPGHGAVVVGRAAVQDWLVWIGEYLESVRTLVQKGLRRGLTPEAIRDTVDYAAFIGDRLPHARHNMPGRHGDTVTKIIQEEQARLVTGNR